MIFREAGLKKIKTTSSIAVKCAQCTECKVPTNTHFEADQFAKGLKIGNRNIICQKRLTLGNCHNHHYGNRWGMLKSMKFTFNVQPFSFFCCLCVSVVHENYFHPILGDVTSGKAFRQHKTKKKRFDPYFSFAYLLNHPPTPQKKEKTSKVTMIFSFNSTSKRCQSSTDLLFVLVWNSQSEHQAAMICLFYIPFVYSYIKMARFLPWSLFAHLGFCIFCNPN